MSRTFSPPLHRQRHQFVINFVKKNKPRRVVDLGCSDCRLLTQLKFHREIELLVGVDINGAKVKKKMHGLAPLSTDYLQPSYDQLRIELYQGSVTQRDARLKRFDLVTCIELIEHLIPTDLDCFSAVVFGYMMPLSVIISTPNSEFNAYLPGLSGFRHSDHKFEWNRAEFRSWALKVCKDYGYEVEFTGVGEAPCGLQDSVGFCSQIGVFYRLAGRDHFNMLPDNDAEDVFSYSLLYAVNYPSLRDNNILLRVLVSEVLYWAEQLKNRWIEEKTVERNGDLAFCPTDEEVEEFNSESPEVVEGRQAGCGDERSRQVDCCGTSDDGEQKGDESLCTKDSKQHVSGAFSRLVSVPLAALWSCCPKVSELSGSVENLRSLLMDEPGVKLSQDGSAVLVKYQEDDKEVDSNLEESEYSEAGWCSYTAELEEDWEASA